MQVPGFSGSSKIIMPGVCGIETVRYMHNYIKGANQRGGSLQNNIRLEIEEVSSRVGLDFIVNVVLNQKRQIVDLFVGDKISAHKQGVKFATKLYCVNPVEDANIVISDTYPFDTSLQFVPSRGFWPLMDGKNKSSKIAIASCPMGLGYHGLSPISMSLLLRLLRKLKYLQLRESLHLARRIKALKKILMRRHLEFMMLSPGITKEELKTVFPKAKLFSTWNEILYELESRHRNLPVKVAIYPCSPLLIPIQDGFSDEYATDR
ncbi:MAG: hypothetical protein C4291_07075 [Candidatus Dadabacteria bacterium]